MKTPTIPNPAEPGRPLRPAEITDRAKRYRANHPDVRPPGPRICAFCGRRSNDRRTVFVGHIDGDESHSNPENLIWTCRACNARHANTAKRAGLGKRTRQFNPRRRPSPSRGARSLAQWVSAVRIMRGDLPGDVRKAVAMIHATPPEDRSEYAREIWRLRREHGTDRLEEVPF